MTSDYRKSPLDNPRLDEGLYLAIIKEVTCRPYRFGKGGYMRILLWLPQEKHQLVTYFYFPQEGDEKSAMLLRQLCRHLGLAPREVLASPMNLINHRVTVKIKTVEGLGQNDGIPYSDVDSFLPADATAKDSKVAI